MHSSRQRGSTLIESMMAMTVMSIGILGLVPLFVTSGSGVATAARLTQATAVAESKLSELVSEPYAGLVAGTYAETSNLGPGGRPFAPGGAACGPYGSSAASDGWFARSWTVTDRTLVEAGDYKDVSVTVSWYDRQAKVTRSVTVSGGRSIPK